MEVDKKNSEEMGDIMPGARDLTDEEITALEAERAAKAEKELAPAKAAAKMRKSSAEIIAEHDDMLAEMLYEMTLKDVEG